MPRGSAAARLRSPEIRYEFKPNQAAITAEGHAISRCKYRVAEARSSDGARFRAELAFMRKANESSSPAEARADGRAMPRFPARLGFHRRRDDTSTRRCRLRPLSRLCRSRSSGLAIDLAVYLHSYMCSVRIAPDLPRQGVNRVLDCPCARLDIRRLGRVTRAAENQASLHSSDPLLSDLRESTWDTDK
jgi:hypothetical protein